MGEIEKRSENLPQNTSGNDNAALPAKLRDSISGTLSKVTGEKASVALASLMRHVEFASDVKAHISRDTILRLRPEAFGRSVEGGRSEIHGKEGHGRTARCPRGK